MIRFSAALVAVAVGVLIGGVATSKLLLVYVAIGVSAVALVALAIGVVLKREELFGEPGASPSLVAAGASAEGPRTPQSKPGSPEAAAGILPTPSLLPGVPPPSPSGSSA